MAEVVPLRQSPLVTDVPGQLRQMADSIEAGEVEIETGTLFIIPQAGNWPIIYGWGEHLSDCGNIAVCELAKQWLIQQATPE